MESLVYFFMSNIGTDKVWTAFLLLAVYYIFKKEPFKVFAHFSEKKEKEHELAKALLELDKLGKEANDFLREHLERVAFHKYYGINADSEMRTALLRFHKKNQRNIGWHNLRRAYPNIQLAETKITAHLSLLSHLFRWLVTVMCWLTSAYALFVMGHTILAAETTSKSQFFSLTGAALILLLATTFFSTLNWEYHSTCKVISLSSKEGE